MGQWRENNICDMVLAIGDGWLRRAKPSLQAECGGCATTVIPDTVIEIEANAFSGCSGLTSIVIPDSVTKIGDFAFNGCTELTDIVVPKSVKTLGNRAFRNCTNLKSVSIMGPVSNLNEPFFIDDPNNIHSFKSLQHENLETLTFGTGIKKISGDLFYVCPNVKTIYV